MFALLMMGGGRLCDILIVHSGCRRLTDPTEVTWGRRRIILGVSQPARPLTASDQPEISNQVLQGRNTDSSAGDCAPPIGKSLYCQHIVPANPLTYNVSRPTGL